MPIKTGFYCIGGSGRSLLHRYAQSFSLFALFITVLKGSQKIKVREETTQRPLKSVNWSKFSVNLSCEMTVSGDMTLLVTVEKWTLRSKGTISLPPSNKRD